MTAPIANEPAGIETIPSGATAVAPATVFAAAPTRVQQTTSEIGENQIIAYFNIRHESPTVYDTLLLSERCARLLLALRLSKRKTCERCESYSTDRQNILRNRQATS